MKRSILTICQFLATSLLVSPLLITASSAYADSAVDTDFGPVYYLEDGETIDYQKTNCKVGLQVYIQEKGEEYNEFMEEHMSNPDHSSNLLPNAIKKYELYREALRTEYFNYNAKVGASTPGQFEQLEICFAIINNEIEERKENLRLNFASGAKDRAAIRYRDRWAVINDRFKNEIHFPLAQFMGRMKSFADGLPCYTNKCAQ